ncbi:MAG: winged helix-turn-helix domain-containing protein [Kiloniellaceae bacterium]
MTAARVIDNRTARRLFLERQGLSFPPHRKLDDAGLLALIEHLGFVQVDSIQTVERAHHMILFARNQTYRPRQLKRLHERDGALFENWTHDASIIPSRFFPHWKLRFAREEARLRPRWRDWHGGKFEAELEGVLKHVADNGRVMARELGNDDEANPKTNGGWWDWHPSKTALEYLWRCGHLAIAARDGFQKVYDLTERTLPPQHHDPVFDAAETVDWACREALQRLGVATSGEIAAFFDLVTPAEAKAWCEARRGGELEEVRIENADGGKPRAAFCFADADPCAALPEPPKRLRVLSPFDPLIRDRKRTERLFGFHYRIEVFVPAAKRKYGYYVFPLLEGDRLIGRLDMKHARDKGALAVKGLWLEPGVALSVARMQRLEAELERQRRFTGAEKITFAKGWVKKTA